jgi:hypothetical protein
MVAFRKLFPVLAIVGLLLGSAVSANAQTPSNIQCTANAGVPPILRAEGFTELTGDIVITCTGGIGQAPFTANFQLFLNTNITSRIIGDYSEALLMIDEPGTARNPTLCVSPGIGSNPSLANPCAIPPSTDFQYQSYNVFRAQRAAQGENAIVWAGVPVVPPGTTPARVFRITNVRANAAGLGASQTLIPTQVVAFVSVTPTASLPIDNPQQTVGYVQQGMLFDVRDCSGGALDASTTLSQCTSVNKSVFDTPTRSDPTNVDEVPGGFGLRFREAFPTAFKRRIATVAIDGADQSISIPGQVFNTESGFVNPAVSAVSPNNGVATSGTRLTARFFNIPAGTRIFVATTNNIGTAATTDTTVPRAVLVSTDPTGTTGFGLGDPIALAGTTNLRCGSTTAAATIPAVEVPIVNGNGAATWEVVAASQNSAESLVFMAAVAYASNTANNLPGLGQSQIAGNLSPFYAAGSAAERASSGLPIPRFVENPNRSNFFRINQCVTNLLFPYVTNFAGFDTGIAISNTSRDPFADPNNRLQGGICTINYYGRLANGNPPATTSERTDRAVEAGEQVTFILSGGGTFGLRGNANFQCYIIAQCGFQYAHGFAFITDGPIGQARVAEGYLALVMDEAIGTRTGSSSESLAH